MGNVKVRIEVSVSAVRIEAILIAERKIDCMVLLPLTHKDVAQDFGRFWLMEHFQERYDDMVDIKITAVPAHKKMAQTVMLPEQKDGEYDGIGLEYMTKADPSIKNMVTKVKTTAIKEEPVKTEVKPETKVMDPNKKEKMHTPHKLNKKGMCIHCCRQIPRHRSGEFCQEAFKDWKDEQLTPAQKKELERDSDRMLHGRMGRDIPKSKTL